MKRFWRLELFVFSSCHVLFEFFLGICTTPKAAGLLSCLQMNIVSFRIKLKWMWHLREVQLEIPLRSPLSAEFNDGSTKRTGEPVPDLLSDWE